MQNTFIHQTCFLDEGAVVGDGTQIWHFCHVMEGARIGTNCVLGQNVFVGRRVYIGNNVRVQNNVSVYSGVILGNDVFVGPSVVFTNVLHPRSFVDRKDEFKTTKVGDGASLGANSTIICGIEIGDYALVGAGSVVTRSVRPYALVAGNPAREVGWVSRLGEPLVFDESGIGFCPRNGDRYQLGENGVLPIE